MTSQQNGPRRIRIGVIFGGQSAEHDVSLRSALTIMGALDETRFEVIPIGISRSGRWITGGDPMAALKGASPMFLLGEGEESSVESLDEDATLALVDRA